MATISVSEVTQIEVTVTINGKQHRVVPKDGQENYELLNKQTALRLLLDSHRIEPVSQQDNTKIKNKRNREGNKRTL